MRQRSRTLICATFAVGVAVALQAVLIQGNEGWEREPTPWQIRLDLWVDSFLNSNLGRFDTYNWLYWKCDLPTIIVEGLQGVASLTSGVIAFALLQRKRYEHRARQAKPDRAKQPAKGCE